MKGWGAGLAWAPSIKVRDLGGPGWPRPVDKSEGLWDGPALGPAGKREGLGAGPAQALSIKVRDWGAGLAQGPKHFEPPQWFGTFLIAHCHVLL